MPTKAPDGGFWAWMAVFGCFMGNVIGDGVMYSFGAFIPYLKDHFKTGSGVTSSIYSLMVGVTFGSGPLASYMTNKLGWRLTTIVGTVLSAAGLALSAVAPNIYFLFFSSGIVLGLGLGIIYLPRLDCITQYFDKRRPFVTGLAICGSGLGTFIFALFVQKLIDLVEWKSSMWIISGICMINCLFAFCFKPLENNQEDDDLGVQDRLTEEKTDEAETTKENKETLKHMVALLKDPIFMLFAVSNFFTSLGYPIPYTFIPDNGKNLNMTTDETSFILSLLGISNTVSRVILGIISQKVNRLFLYNTCLVVCGASMAVSNFYQPMFSAIAGTDCTDYPLNNSTNPEDYDWTCGNYVGQVLYVSTFGVTSAAYVLLTTLVLADLLGPDKFTNSFGLLLLFQGVATLIGPPIVGFMFDAYGNYDFGFVLMGIMITFSGAMLYPIPCIQKNIQKKSEKTACLEDDSALHI